MTDSFPAFSTYTAPFTITDREGNPIDLSSAEVTFSMTRESTGDESLFTATESDSAVEIQPGGETGLVEVTVPASEVPEWTVFEELRVSLGGTSIVVSQRTVTFESVATEP